MKQKPEIWREVQSSSNVSLLYDGRLQINRVSPEDAGMYTCSDKGETIFALAELIILGMNNFFILLRVTLFNVISLLIL